MIRPTKPDTSSLKFEEYIDAQMKYDRDMEKYCDELETINERMVWHVKKCNEQSKKIGQLEKVVDNACEILEKATEQIVINGKKKQDWKEYLMKEVQDE